MTASSAIANATELTPDAYVVVGLAACFVREDGEVHPIQILEPIPSAALEALMKGIPTSYELAIATTVGAILGADQATPQRPDEFPTAAQFCDDFVERVYCAARTYQAVPTAQHLIPIGSSKSDFAFSTERKRILNSQRLVRTEDNVKQHAYTHQVL